MKGAVPGTAPFILAALQTAHAVLIKTCDL